MPGVIPNYKEGPTSWPVCGYQGVGAATVITGGQLCHPNAAQNTMVEPQLAGGKDTLGVAANDAAAPRTSQDSQNPAVISQQPDIVALYYGMDIDVTYASNANCGGLLVAAAAGAVSEYVPAISAPSFPATATAVQNATGYEANVVISGGTISSVNVGPSSTAANNPQVGTGDGTYVVPAGQYISVTFTSTAPTWTWSTAGTLSTPDAIVGRCTQPGGVNIATNVVGSARIITVL